MVISLVTLTIFSGGKKMVRNLKSLVFEIAKPGFIFARLENGIYPYFKERGGRYG
jgi:hypothetical protein